MLRTPLAAAIAVALTFAMAGCPGQKNAGSGGDTGPDTASRTPTEVVDAGKRLVESWRQAWEVRAVDGLAPLYAQDLDVVLVAQGEVHLGWTAVETYLSTTMGAAKEIHIRLDDLQVAALGSGAAVVTATMTRETSDGVTSVSERGALTLAIRAQGGTWVIVSEHYSYPRTAQ
jgi:uncharacterized protein (TIGR02246 family)